MPKLKSAWAAWSFVASSAVDTASDAVCVSYWLNTLQNLDPSVAPLFVTLNPPEGLPKAESIIHRVPLHHPVFR